MYHIAACLFTFTLNRLIAAGAQTETSESTAVSWTAQAAQILAQLLPDAYFTKGQPISRPQVRLWEAALKGVLQSWAADSSQAAQEATNHVLQQIKAMSAWDSARAAATATQAKIHPEEFYTMLKGLDGKGMLPALAFSFDRRNCERLAGMSSSTSHVTCHLLGVEAHPQL